MSVSRPGPRATPVFDRLVVGVDRYEGGRDALALAELLREVCGGEVVAVYIYPFDRSMSLDEADLVEAGLYEDLLAELGQELTRAGVAARPIVVADAFAAHALHAIAERDGAECRARLRRRRGGRHGPRGARRSGRRAGRLRGAQGGSEYRRRRL
jgi:nucleotide-binding universal stress UspA family protein